MNKLFSSELLIFLVLMASFCFGQTGERSWSALPEFARNKILCDLIDGTPEGSFYLVRNRIDESLRFSDIDEYPGKEKTFYSALITHGFQRLELLGTFERERGVKRLYLSPDRQLGNTLSSIPRLKYYEPLILPTDDVLIGLFKHRSRREAIEIIGERSIYDNDAMQSVAERDLYESQHDVHDVVELISGCCFGINTDLYRNTGSFSNRTIIPLEQIDYYRRMSARVKESVCLIQLSTREASEMLYVLLGEDTYKTYMTTPLFDPVSRMENLETELGSQLRSLKTSPNVLAKLRKDIRGLNVNVMQREGASLR